MEEIDLLIVKYLGMGMKQEDVSSLLKRKGIRLNSVSIIEKRLRRIKNDFGAKSLFHLGVILNKKGIVSSKEEVVEDFSKPFGHFWTLEDIISHGGDVELTYLDACAIAQSIDDCFDAEIGISWDVIENHIEKYLKSKKE